MTTAEKTKMREASIEAARSILEGSTVSMSNLLEVAYERGYKDGQNLLREEAKAILAVPAEDAT